MTLCICVRMIRITNRMGFDFVMIFQRTLAQTVAGLIESTIGRLCLNWKFENLVGKLKRLAVECVHVQTVSIITKPYFLLFFFFFIFCTIIYTLSFTYHNFVTFFLFCFVLFVSSIISMNISSLCILKFNIIYTANLKISLIPI